MKASRRDEDDSTAALADRRKLSTKGPKAKAADADDTQQERHRRAVTKIDSKIRRLEDEAGRDRRVIRTFLVDAFDISSRISFILGSCCRDIQRRLAIVDERLVRLNGP